MIPRPSLSAYFSASRLRTDSWNRLKSTTRHLAESAAHEHGARGESAEFTSAERGPSRSTHYTETHRLLATLEPLEGYWAYPGKVLFRELKRLLEEDQLDRLSRATAAVVRTLVSDAYRSLSQASRARWESHVVEDTDDTDLPQGQHEARPYFEVLVVDHISEREEHALREQLGKLRRPDDEFIYDIVVVPSFEDALIAALLNYNVQSCVIRYGFPIASSHKLELLQRTLGGIQKTLSPTSDDSEVGLLLAQALSSLRPTLDLFLVTDAPVEDIAGRVGRHFRRVFYRQEDYLELHLSILKGIRARYNTPFFSALRSYSQRPTGVFHALPISRSKSITKSHWIRDMGDFFGHNIFLAETSATIGGLDSLLQPHGPLKAAQSLAARAFGAKRSYFVTNGTSTANKIVMQALIRPDDIVLVSRDCHKSHHYALLLSGGQPVYLDPYPLNEYAIYGAVPLAEIKRQLLALRKAGKLDRVRMLLLTNSTFDGVFYNTERVMEEVLALKPDMIFVWDEAWSAFASFTPIMRKRTAMETATSLRDALKHPRYAERYAHFRDEVDLNDDAACLTHRLLPDPERAQVRVYATQSTHKTLTSLRQGSMIHVHDQLFEKEVEHSFSEAYMTHTSTSPNYPILASLDVGRRQVELEGYELVQHSIELALTLRERINTHPLLSRYFRMLTPEDLIPKEFRQSAFRDYQDVKTDWAQMDEAWQNDELCLDPTRLSLYVGKTGIDGNTFKRILMDRYDIQINKTSRNTVLFMTHIGSTRGSVAYLIEVLNELAQELDRHGEDAGAIEQALHETQVLGLTENPVALPSFSAFHAAFRADATPTREGDLRRAFFLGVDECNCESLRLDGTVERALAAGREVVSAAFVTPYPPGFPVLVPGQLISSDILLFLKALDVKEIHGYKPNHGLRVFRGDILKRS